MSVPDSFVGIIFLPADVAYKAAVRARLKASKIPVTWGMQSFGRRVDIKDVIGFVKDVEITDLDQNITIDFLENGPIDTLALLDSNVACSASITSEMIHKTFETNAPIGVSEVQVITSMKIHHINVTIRP